jgi:hypothetical protein
MQTIIMTVGTSLLTNPDKNLQPQRPWVGQKTIGDPERALAWMKKTDLELNQRRNQYLLPAGSHSPGCLDFALLRNL